MIRVCAYVDGFNLYHAVDALKDNRLKWLNLRSLVQKFIDPNTHQLDRVYYFSAYADWLPDATIRHKIYTAALQQNEVTAVMGNFKKKDRKCRSCKSTWIGHEEKETDVNIAIQLLDDAYRNLYDQAIIISQDSDLFPALRMITNRFPTKKLKIITPPNLRHSKSMAKIVGHKNLSSIKQIHLERCQLPDEVFDSSGKLVAKRPDKYKAK